MRAVLPDKLERGRVITGEMASNASWGPYGKFFVQGPCGERLCIVASGAAPEDIVAKGWEHVSVSTRKRIPNWIEMCFVKDLFWDDDECVVQFHPPRSAYVNCHPYTLHLWRPTRYRDKMPMPPSILVGPK